MSVDVSVLVPVLDEAPHLREVVARMQAQDFDGTLELLFVDGGSTDASRAILAELAAADQRIRILENPRRRTPFALNIGLGAARGEFVARMDAHTRYPSAYLRLGVERLRRGDVVHVSGPALATGDGTVWGNRVALALSTSFGTGGAGFRALGADDDGEFDVDTGFAGVWRRDVLLAAGGWDEGWPTDQDCELAFRLAADGGRHVCLNAMAAEYLPRASLSALRRQYWQYGLHKVKTFRRHPAAMRPSHLLPLGLALTLSGALAAPARPLRRLARAGVLAYGGSLALGGVRASRSGVPGADAAALPAVYATMHVAYGLGLVAGMRRYGVPLRAIASAARRAA